MVRRVGEHLHIRVRLLEGFNRVKRNPLVFFGKVGQHRHLRVTRDFGFGRHAAAVVGRSRRQAF